MRRVTALITLTFAACGAAPDAAVRPDVQTWGSMREALRDARSEARIRLSDAAVGTSVGVGALAGLAGEVTILDGRALVARAAPDGTCQITDADDDDHATLLVTASVPAWRSLPLPDCPDYAALDAAIGSVLRSHGFDPGRATPVRIRGRAANATYHVIAGACPIANPTGTPPWRFQGPLAQVELVGIYAEGAAGRLTHHVHTSHLHLVADGHMGHLDDIDLRSATLQLPASPTPPTTPR